MRALLVLVVGLGAIVACPDDAAAKCGDGPNDTAQVAAARGAVDTTCPCATFTSHGAYVRCAVGVARNRELGGMLRAECVRNVKRCASKSTCGRPGSVTCCTTRANGERRCRIKPSAIACAAPACAGVATSCCDACDQPPCVATTTSTTSQSTTSTTIAAVPCTGGSPAPTCDGTCPPGSHCEGTAEFGTFDCACFPDGVTACGDSGYPTCGGACVGGLQCIPVRVSDFSSNTTVCVCVGPTAECASPGTIMCSPQFPGPCPPGQVCGTFLCGPGCADCGCGPP